MTCIHDNKVNNISEWNVLHDILNPHKTNENWNIHYYHILHGCMNTRNVKSRFKNIIILLDSGCISTIVMGRIFRKLHPKNMLWWPGTCKMVILLLILRLKWILPYLNVARRMLWCGNVMWMTLLRSDTMQSY